MSTTELSSYQSARSSLSPSQAFGLVLDSAVSTVAGRLERTTAGWIDRLSASTDRHHSSAVGTELADAGLDAAADSGGVARRAGAEGVKAHLHGRSPAWAAVRTAWQTGSPAVRAAMAIWGLKLRAVPLKRRLPKGSPYSARMMAKSALRGASRT